MGATVRDSVLWEGAEVAADARLSRCIVATGARVPAGAQLADSLVVPAGRSRSRVLPL